MLIPILVVNTYRRVLIRNEDWALQCGFCVADLLQVGRRRSQVICGQQAGACKPQRVASGTTE